MMMYQSQFIEMFGDISKARYNFQTKKLGDICRVINGRAYSANELLSEGKYRVLRVGNFFSNDSWYYSDMELEPDKYCDAGDLLFAWSCTLGPRIWEEEKAIFHYHIWKITDYEQVLETSFFFEQLKHIAKKMKSETHGSTMVHLTKSQFESEPIIVPPVQSQKDFVDILAQADKSKFDWFKSQFIEMFGSMITPKYNVLPMVSVCERSGQYGSNTSACDYISDTPRYIRITDINDDGSLNDDIKSAEAIDDKYLLKDGDLVFARTGATVGKTYLHHSGKAIYAGYLIKYHPIESRVNPEYLFAYTHSSSYYAWVELTKKEGAQPNISATQYDELPVIVPPIDKQNEFVMIARQADKSKSVCLNTIKRLAS